MVGWIEGRRRWVWLAGLAFVALLLTPVGASDAVPVSSGEDIMIIAAHPDDDVITAAGVIWDAPADVTVAFLTNGDRCESQSQVDNGRCAVLQPGIGTIRQGEAVDGQAELGTAESDVIFLGYPNGFLDKVRYNNQGTFPVLFHTETYASRGLGGTDWHDYRTPGDAHVAYPSSTMSQDLLDDVIALIDTYRPDHIFTHMRWDRHEDHRSTYYTVIDAVENVRDGDPGYSPYIHTALVHVKDPAQWNEWPADPNPTTPVNEYSDLGEDTDSELVWDQRESFEVPPSMQNPYFSGTNPKAEAIEAHSSQVADGGFFIRNFAHSDEVFWVERLGSAEGRADLYVVDEGGPLTVSGSGVLRNDVRGVSPDGSGIVDVDPLGPMSSELVVPPNRASAFSLDADGSFTYTHDGSETSTDSFTYRPVQGSTDGSVATVTINVNPINDPPNALADGPFVVSRGASGNLPVLDNDSDPENDDLTPVADSSPDHGSLTVNGDGSFTYTHNGSAGNTDSFTYHVRDIGGLTSAPVTVSIQIDDAVPGPPEVNLSGPGFGAPGTTAKYTATVTGGSGPATISWSVFRDFVEVDSGVGSSFDFTPDTAGAHEVMVTVEDDAGVDSDSLDLTVMGDIGGNVFASDILWLAEEGVTKGCNPPANDQFCPKAQVTRGQMAAFLVRFLDLTASDDSINFTDTVGNIFEGDIRKLATAGITRGCNPPTNSQFCPNEPVTRGQMAAFLGRALDLEDDGGGNLFTDDDASIFEADIDKLATAGVTKGCNADGTHFCPNSSVTREQMAAFLHRAASLLP